MSVPRQQPIWPTRSLPSATTTNDPRVVPRRSSPHRGLAFITYEDGAPRTSRIFAKIKGLAARVQSVSDTLDAKQCVSAGSIDFETADDALTRSRQLLRQLRNFTQPVMRLPPEIFGLIFLWVQAMCNQRTWTFDPFMVQEPLKFHGDQWVRVAHVCRYWRAVTWKCSHLWSTLLLDDWNLRGSACKVACHLQASGALPLTAEIPSIFRLNSRIALAILQRLRRIRRLRLAGEISTAMSTIIATQEAPLLEAFAMYTIVDDWRGDDPDDIDASDPVTLPTLFKGVHPNLTSLSFCTYRRYGDNDFQNIRHLHISEQGFVTPDDFRALLEFLEGVPRLEDLMLSKTRPTIMLESSPELLNARHHRISLPQLRRLVLSEVPLSFAGLVFDSLALPREQILATLFKPREVLFEGLDDVDFQEVTISELQRLGAQWGQMVWEAHTASICAHAQGFLHVAAIGYRREMCLEQMHGDLEEAQVVLHGLVQRVAALWLHITESEHFNESDTEELYNTLCPAWFLQNAPQARTIYLNINIRGQGPLPILAHLCNDPESPLAMWEECHLSVNHSDSELTEGETFFAALSTCGVKGVIFHIYLHVDYRDKTTDPVPRWQDALRRAGPDMLRCIKLHFKEAFPQLPLSTQCVFPPTLVSTGLVTSARYY